MLVEPTADQGQTIAPPLGKVIGFFESRTSVEAFAKAAQAAGHSALKMTSLYGEDGIRLLKRLKEHSFFFGDSEDSIIQLSIRELEQGHYVAAVEVADHHQAEQIVSLAKPQGGHGFSYFGKWVTEQLSS